MSDQVAKAEPSEGESFSRQPFARQNKLLREEIARLREVIVLLNAKLRRRVNVKEKA